MSKPWIAMSLVLTLAIGITVGVGVGALWFDDDSDAADASISVDCDEAAGVVDAALARVEEIDASENRDPGYYAALIVEQRSIVFAMEAAPACFPLQDRAGAVGLLEGIHSLLDAFTAISDAGATTVPADSSSTDE